MKVAIVHDYLKEYGGAERVLEALSEIWPEAPIYTSFYTKGSAAYEQFKDKDVRVSWVHYVPFFATKLHSPLRFLAPLIWGSFKEEFKKYDVVISSASWYVTKGFGSQRQKTKDKRPIEVCYCHTPPRWLYGYKTSIEWQKYWPVRAYASIVGHFMRQYDFNAAQRVDYFIANSKEVANRIRKFYRRESTVIYPPVSLVINNQRLEVSKKENLTRLKALSSNNYYFIVSRLVGAKGIDLAIKAAQKLKVKLKIAGAPAGYYSTYKQLTSLAKNNVEFLGRVSDEELVSLYSNAKAFLALAQDEDFGITPVEAMACGTPVIAFRGGGYVESVIDPSAVSSGQGPTGVFFNEPTVDSLVSAIKQFNNLTIDSNDCIKQAEKFSKERFKRQVKKFVEKSVLSSNGLLF